MTLLGYPPAAPLNKSAIVTISQRVAFGLVPDRIIPVSGNVPHDCLLVQRRFGMPGTFSGAATPPWRLLLNRNLPPTHSNIGFGQ